MSAVVVAALLAALAGGARLASWLGPLARDASEIAWSVEGAAGRQAALWCRCAAEGLGIGVVLAGLTPWVAVVAGSPPWAAAAAAVAGLAPLLLLLLAGVAERDDVPHRLTGPADALLLVAVVVAASAAGPWPALAALGWAGVVVARTVRRDGGRGRAAGRLSGSQVPAWRLVAAARHRRAARSGVALLDAEVVAAVRRSEAVARRRRLPVGLVRGRALRDLALTVGARGVAPLLVLLPGLELALHGVAVVAPTPAIVLLVLAEHASVVRLLGVVRTWMAAPALGAAWGRLGPGAVVALCLPAVLAGWLVAAVGGAAVGVSVGTAVVLLALPPLVAWRQARSARAAGGLVLLSTPMGPVPVQTIVRAVAGHDVALLALLILG